jgi:hypothetical protein
MINIFSQLPGVLLYEEHCLPGYDVTKSGGSLPTSQRNTFGLLFDPEDAVRSY